MTDEPDNLILQHLRAIREQLERMNETQASGNARLSAIEQHMLGLHLDAAATRERLDRVESRLERIEKRLGLIEA